MKFVRLCVLDPITGIPLSKQFAILWIKSSWAAKIRHVNKRKLVWYDALSVRCRYLIGFCSVFGEGIISTAEQK